MASHLVVITGAGASFDCAVSRGHPHRNPNAAYRPPLTRELFQPLESFGPILDHYPGARAAAADIRVRLRTQEERQEAFALEAYLREELKESDNPDARYRFRQIPLYLQHLLFEVGRRYTTDPENYARLVNGALGSGIRNVVFVTLNYDTILDRELFHRTVAGAVRGQPRELVDYVSDREPWALIKLHGSVNWGRRVHIPEWLRAELGNVEPGPVYTGWFDWLADLIDGRGGGPRILDREIQLRLSDDIADMRRTGDDLFYPALAVPIGPDPELGNCPSDHRLALRRRLASMESRLNVLVIGYSGLDDEVLDLLSEGGTIGRLAIVDHDPGAVHQRFEAKFGPLSPEYLPTGFSDWAQSSELEAYFERIAAAE